MRTSGWVPPFAAATALHLVLLAAGAEPWGSVSKCLLAPVLLGWALHVRGPRLLAAALVLCLLGDLFLELDGFFLPGMVAFAGAHVCLVTLFVRCGALRHLRTLRPVVVTYVVAGVALVVWAWAGLAPELRVAVPVYAALLLATAVTSLAVDRVAGLGGLLFLVSDGVIALGEAGRVPPDAVATQLVIMTLYASAIALLTAGTLRTTHSGTVRVRAAR